MMRIWLGAGVARSAYCLDDRLGLWRHRHSARVDVGAAAVELQAQRRRPALANFGIAVDARLRRRNFDGVDVEVVPIAAEGLDAPENVEVTVEVRLELVALGRKVAVPKDDEREAGAGVAGDLDRDDVRTTDVLRARGHRERDKGRRNRYDVPHLSARERRLRFIDPVVHDIGRSSQPAGTTDRTILPHAQTTDCRLPTED